MPHIELTTNVFFFFTIYQNNFVMTTKTANSFAVALLVEKKEGPKT